MTVSELMVKWGSSYSVQKETLDDLLTELHVDDWQDKMVQAYARGGDAFSVVFATLIGVALGLELAEKGGAWAKR